MKKKLILILLLLTSVVCYSQNSINIPPLSVFSVGLFGGISTTDFQEMEGSGLIELETNLSQSLFFTFSAGQYLFNKADVSNLVRGRVNPIAIGSKYFLMHGHSSPYLSVEAGYNFYETVSNEEKKIKQNTFYSGMGFGIYYNHTKHIKLEMKYSYKFNNKIKDVNLLMVGIIYSF